MSFKIPQRHRSSLDFFIHVTVGTIAYAMVFGAAVLISTIVKLMEGWVPSWVHKAAEISELVVFALDLFCFGLLMLTETFKWVRSQWKEVVS